MFGSDGQESGVLSRSGSRISAIFGDSQPDPISQSKDPFAAARVKGETSTSGGDARRALFRDEPAQTPALTLPSAPSGGLLSGFGNLFSTSPGNAESSTSSESLAGSDAEPQSQASRTPAEVVVVDESNPSAVVRAEKERARKGKTEAAQAETDGDGQAESGSGVLSGFASLFATQESSQDASTGEASETQSETTESTSSQNQANSVAQTFVPAERVEGRRADRSESSAKNRQTQNLRKLNSTCPPRVEVSCPDCSVAVKIRVGECSGQHGERCPSLKGTISDRPRAASASPHSSSCRVSACAARSCREYPRVDDEHLYGFGKRRLFLAVVFD